MKDLGPRRDNESTDLVGGEEEVVCVLSGDSKAHCSGNLSPRRATGSLQAFYDICLGNPALRVAKTNRKQEMGDIRLLCPLSDRRIYPKRSWPLHPHINT
ncbi:unnamed protein product [Protopolystoma xenopodis]|uniref:Uncharacterized protein n=1 Tax=Protopolystoma xenopodis TaxID=117903 RepID=A0A448WIH7_9PLAT|nr:unnamed protein product [Protopolystoma xenopodis]